MKITRTMIRPSSGSWSTSGLWSGSMNWHKVYSWTNVFDSQKSMRFFQGSDKENGHWSTSISRSRSRK